MDNQVLDHLKEQTTTLIREKQRWDNVKQEKENDNNNERKHMDNKKVNKKQMIEKYEKQFLFILFLESTHLIQKLTN